MTESYDAFRYIGYLRARWRWIAGSCAVAVLLAAAASISMTKQYTATARIVIEPPAGTDLRAAMAVSPIYLESLKTYELFAESDSLFRSAIERFQLRNLLGRGPIESLKNRVLKVSTVRNTRILEIAVKLPDPVKAQALARFLAESTVAQNRSLVAEGDEDLVKTIEQQVREARVRLEQSEAEWAHALVLEPVDDLQAGIGQAGRLRAAVQEQMLGAEVAIADAAERAKQASAAQQPELRSEQSNARARLTEMQNQIRAIDRQTAEKEKLLAARMSHREKLEAERKAMQTSLAAVETRLRDARGEAGYRGERLKIIDPGIVPERPSSPNLPLNILAALMAGLVLPILYLTLTMRYQEQRATARLHARHAFAKARDE